MPPAAHLAERVADDLGGDVSVDVASVPVETAEETARWALPGCRSLPCGKTGTAVRLCHKDKEREDEDMAMYVIVAKYKDVLGAKDAISAVKDAGIKLVDQAYVLNNGDGNIEFKEGKDAGGGKGFVYGASTVAVAGLLLGPVGWGAIAAGGVVGGLVAKLHDAGIRSSDIEALGSSLEPGHAAAIAVTQEGDQDRVGEILFDYGGEIAKVSMTDDVKSALEGDAPAGVTISEDGSIVGTA